MESDARPRSERLQWASSKGLSWILGVSIGAVFAYVTFSLLTDRATLVEPLGDSEDEEHALQRNLMYVSPRVAAPTAAWIGLTTLVVCVMIGYFVPDVVDEQNGLHEWTVVYEDDGSAQIILRALH